MDRPPVFADRTDAGRRLADTLRGRFEVPLVAGIPRGGVAVAAEVAAALDAPLRAVVARKVGAPGHRELALGAVGPDGVAVLDRGLVARVGATDRFVDQAVEEARAEVEARLHSLPGVLRAGDAAGRTVVVVDDGVAVLDRGLVARVGATDRFVDQAVEEARAEVEARLHSLPGVLRAGDAAGRTVVVVDDGVATGATAAAVGRWLATTGATRRVLALPVGPADTVARLGDEYDEVVTLLRLPTVGFYAVGPWYRDFRQVRDDEVAALLGA